ncbi:MAG: hypothetical protein ACREQ5_09695, partial [Candidatus Dormibacteria bacterium]
TLLALKTLPGAVKTPAIVPVAVAPAPVEEKRVPNPAAGLKPLRVEGITMAPDGVKQPTIKPAIVVPPVMTEAQPAGDSPATAPPQAATTAPEDAPKVRRRRRTKTEMEAARSAEGQSVQETANMPETANTDPQSASAAVIDPVIIKVGNRLAENAVALINKEVSQAIETARAVPAESLSESNPPEGQVVASFDAPASLAIGDLPNAEQMKNFVTRLTVYRNEILPNQGKMIPSHGMGVNAKIRAFFKAACPGTEGLQNLTVPQWETVLGFMDLALKEQGAEKLVEVINYNVGATDEAKENTNETNS